MSITDNSLTVDLQGLHKLWAFKSRIRVPLAHVRGATADQGMIHEPKGLRAPGLHLPGAAVIGTFHRDGQRHFWDVRRGADAIVIELVNESYARLVIEVEDPHGTVDKINRVTSRGQS